MIGFLKDLHFSMFGFKKESKQFHVETLKNYANYIKGTKLDTKSMKRYIKRVEKNLNNL